MNREPDHTIESCFIRVQDLGFLLIRPPLETYEQYVDASQAAHQIDYNNYPKPDQSRYEQSQLEGATKIALVAYGSHEVTLASQRVVQVLAEKHSLVVEPAPNQVP